MNNLIKQLAERATVVRKTFHGIERIEFDKEKFAEMIVKEAAKVAEYYYTRGECVSPTQMKQHFGIE